VRTDGDAREQTLKFAAAGPAGMQNCEEWTLPLAGAKPDLSAFDPAALARLGQRAGHLRLRPLFTTDIERTTRLLQTGSTRFEMSVDLGQIRAHGATKASLPVSEVEFELLDGSPLELFDFLLRLLDSVELHPLFPSKAERGYVLAHPSLRVGAAKAAAVQLDRRMSVGAAFQTICGEALRHLLGNIEATGAGHPEALHQSRVAIRRIRAALHAFRGVLPRRSRREFNDAFRGIQAALSPARDWHIFREECLPAMVADGALGRASRKRLGDVVDEALKRSLGAAAAALHSRSCTRLLLDFQCWLLRLEADAHIGLGGKLRPFARQVLDASRRDLLADPRPLARMQEEERHELRKRGKRSRYATEFFAGLWDDAEVPHYLKLIAHLQDHLGPANDAVVARQLVAGLDAPSLRASDRRRVEDWARAREQACIRAAQSVWRRVQKLEPFWR
jgi:inorganic triphosphatase YgiF